MSNAFWLAENLNSDWVEKIPLIQVDDPVLGGVGGPVNVPHQALSDRTNHLKRSVDQLRRDFDSLDHRAAELEERDPPPATAQPLPDNIVLRDAAGRAQIEGPAANKDIANKGYVDDAIAGISGADVAKEYVDSHINGSNVHSATSLPTALRLVFRDSAGRAQVEAPAAEKDIANKGYVDSKSGAAASYVSCSFICA